ncbi:uncharacterized protein K460DRAFT_366220 [Cucurbitaria berberidis CBS 394.84]|uniref:DUF7730 domain-containing protein n=1 Tax=Cucurbitaria berberidis CBS 394.84 TaxID=1168544 RepID=A0A9P4GFX8_9PLEO|nr:uncharacterized protein K460DRAFT_366220 [Cucurbitaria berberidis CBS 394.84]KAF1845343.1 hypothetical protein K460DRAFT_366220 [Cucurbitaria berberidis CBS 394.84]
MLDPASKADVDSTQTLVMEMHGQMGHSRLLSLPKELRLEIWRYVLTDPPFGKHVLCICRETPSSSSSSKRFSNSLYKGSRPAQPQIKTAFQAIQVEPININLLRTNRLVYGEALPILYHSVKFWPQALEGIFPVFLEKLSPFARTHIRHIRLRIQESTFGNLFPWAITCAQVAKLGDSLRVVEVEGNWPLPGSKCQQHRLLYPLLRIKAPKKFVGDHDVEFQQMMTKAAKELEAKALLRSAFTAADAAARAKRDEPPNKKQQSHEIVFRVKATPFGSLSEADEEDATENPRTMSGIQITEKDLEEWDMVSVRSASPSRKRARIESISDEAIVVGVEEDDADESEDWEWIDKSH